MLKSFFSVVVPCLNEEKYLPRLLKSLSLQTYKLFEVFVVDGKSTDLTKEKYQLVEKSLPKSQFIISPKANVAFQRNLGAQKAKGEYLVFLDADTQVPPHFLEQLKRKIDNKEFVFASTWIKPDSKKILDKLMLSFGNYGTALARFFSIPLAGGYNTIIKRDIFLKLGGYRDEVIYNEDYDFSFKAKKNHVNLKILTDPKVTYSMRRFRSEPLYQLIPKMALGQMYMYLVGPITKDIFKYRMGGHVHQEKKSH